MKTKLILSLLFIPTLLTLLTRRSGSPIRSGSSLRSTFVFCLLSFVFFNLSSQVPQGFNYQAIARDGSGNPITDATMQVKIGILSDTIANTMVWEELFNPVKTNAFGMFTIVVGTGVKQSGSASTFSAIDWTKTPLFLRTSIYYPSTWKVMGTSKLQSVPYSMVAGNLEGTVPLLSVKGYTTTMDSALFVVRNNTGQIVFAVYNEGVRIYVDDGVAKGARKGGFAIGSFDKSKGTSQPYFVVDPDSIRAYIDNNPVKAVKGGFAIGGFDKSKATGNQQFFIVSDDSVRVYIDDNLTKATTKGGFAVGSFDKSKGGNANYFNVSPDSTGIVYPSQNRILWYPLKNALLTGKVIAENKDSVGVNSFASGYESRSKGKYSQALGYKAIARGDYSTALGFATKASNEGSTAMGHVTTASGMFSTAIGSYTQAIGSVSTAIGNSTQAIGAMSTAMGMGTSATGNYSTTMGNYTSALSGYETVIGRFNTTYTPVSTTDWNITDRLFVIGNGTDDATRSNAMTVLKNGNIGIGIATPGTKLAIAGLTGSATGSTLIINGNNIYYLTSKKDSKKDIIPLSDNFEKILQAQPVSFTDKATGMKGIGYIAEEFEKEGLKNLLVYEDGKLVSLRYDLISVYNLEIIKQQQTCIETVAHENQQLRSELDELKTLVSTLAANQTGQGNK